MNDLLVYDLLVYDIIEYDILVAWYDLGTCE